MTRRSMYLALAMTALPSALRAQAPAVPEVKAFAVYQLPEAKRITLPNGLVVLLLEKHELPLTSVTIGLRTGSLLDPANKPGVSDLVAGQIRQGTMTRTADQLSNELDFIGMEIGGQPGLESTAISGDFLSKDTDQALTLMADMVLHPSFPAAELQKAVARRRESLKTDKDTVYFAVTRYFMATLYAGHPYAHPFSETDASLSSITRDDLVAFHRLVYTPANSVIAVAGDFKTSEMEARIKALFGTWQGPAPATVSVPVLKPVTGRHVLLVDKPDATQTYFIVGNVGISEKDPDRASIKIVNTLFGGRFTSLFNEELRVKSGYSYGASSYFQTMRTPGPFEMSTYTKNATTEPAMNKTFEVIDRLHTHPFTEADLLSAKNYLRGTFPPSLETTPELANRLVIDEVEGITREQFNAELAQEQATTLADANRVIDKDFLAKDNYVLVIVGKASEIGGLAAKYGAVTKRSITDPGY